MASHGGYSFEDVTTQILGSALGVNMKNTGQTALYTVPAGKTLIINNIVPIVATANTVAVVPSVRIGKSPSYTEWMAITALTGLDGAGKYLQLNAMATAIVRQTFAAGEVVALDVTTGATATALTMDFFLFGNII